MFYINKIARDIVFIGLFFFGLNAQAGSYEDFFKAVQVDNVRTVQTLLQRGFDPNTVNPDGVPALMVAVREPSLKVAELLASWPQTRTEVRNAHDESPLMLAALKGFLPLVKKLVNNDADVNKPGWTPLHYAATGGHVPVIEFLLDESAYIDAESPNGTTPLMMAAHYGTPMATKLLLEEGADPRIQNQLGINALEISRKANKPESMQYI
jgi:ankyrin repeat protein